SRYYAIVVANRPTVDSLRYLWHTTIEMSVVHNRNFPWLAGGESRQEFACSRGVARPDPLALPIAHLQQLPASRSCKLPAFPITSARTQRLTAKLASPESESLLGGGTSKRAISNVVVRGHF